MKKNRIMISKLNASRKKANLKYWFFAGDKEEEGDRDKDGIIDAVDDTKDIIAVLQHKQIALPGDIVFTEDPDGKHDYHSWSRQLPAFLVWAFGK